MRTIQNITLDLPTEFKEALIKGCHSEERSDEESKTNRKHWILRFAQNDKARSAAFNQRFLNERNFALVEYVDEKGENRPAYSLTRDAFALVAMGFTGKEALAWKVRYIEAFNAMEKSLLEEQKNVWLPAKEAPERNRQRKIALVKALAAIWAHADGVCVFLADTALCAHLEVKTLDDIQLSDVERAANSILTVLVDTPNTYCAEDATWHQRKLISRIASGCEKFRYVRDTSIFDDEIRVRPSRSSAEKTVQHACNVFFWRFSYTSALNNLT